MKSEHSIQNEIRLALSRYGICLRLNSGRAYGGKRVWDNRRGEYILTNLNTILLCPKGTADLLFIGENGTIAFIEVKDNKGRVRTEQSDFITLVKSYGYRAGVARSVDDALHIIGVSSTPSADNRCLFCGEIIPEGRQICPSCERDN